jgi:2-dehydropantoate 2-reductase
MRILIVGAGSVGGYFGGRLAGAGRDVTFLVRAARAQQLRQDGLRIISPHGDLTLAPRLVSAGAMDGPYDRVFLSVKAYALESVIADLAPAVGPQSLILPALNGMRHIERLSERFGPDRVIGGVCLVATELDDQGRIVQIADIQQLAYGERDGQATPRLKMLDQTLQNAGFNARLSTNIMQAMWEKWVQLASLGAITCLMRAPVGDIVAVPGGADFALKVLDECAAIANACGHSPSSSFLNWHAEAISKPRSNLTSSMYRDMRKGAPVEVDHILGDLLKRGAAQSVSAPLLNAAFIRLHVYQGTVSNR